VRGLSKDQSQAIYEYSDAGILFLRIVGGSRPELELQNINPKCCELLGCSSEEINAEGIELLMTGGQATAVEHWKRNLRAAVDSGPQAFQWSFLRRDGSNVELDIRVRRLENQGDSFLVAFMRDTSRSEASHDPPESSEHGCHGLVDHLTEDVARWDADGRYSYVNAAHARTLGEDARAVVGRNVPDSLGKLKMAVAQALATGQPVLSILQTVNRDDGSDVVYDVNLVPERDADGKIVGVIGLGRDVTRSHRDRELIIVQEQELRSLIESSPDFIISYDREGRTRYLNSALLEELELTNAEELIGKRPSETWPDGRFDDIERTAAQVVETGTEVTIEFRGLDPEGTPFFRDIRVCPRRDLLGNTVGTIAYGRDTTHLKEQEKRLLILSAAMDHLSDTVLLMDEQSHFIYANESACKNLGFTREELATMTPVDIDPDLDEDALGAMVAAHNEMSHDPGLERRHRSKDGRIYPVDISVCRVFFGHQRFVLTLSRDISERKFLQNVIEQRERDFRALAEGIPDTVIRFDRQERIVYANPAMADYFGIPRTALIGRLSHEVWPDGRYAAIAEAVGRVLSGASKRESIDIAGPNVEPEVLLGQVVIVPEHDDTRDVVGAIAIGRDLSRVRLAEMEARRREREFRSLAESTPSIIARYTPDGHATYMNPGFEKNLGPQAGAMLSVGHGRGLEVLRNFEAHLRGVARTGLPDDMELSLPHTGRSFHVRFVAERDGAGNIASVLAVGSDITERKEMEDDLREHQQRLANMAFHDSLTGLPNRTLLADRMSMAIVQAKRTAEVIVVVYLDLDNFKPVNDVHGHEAGDWVLAEVSTRMLRALREGDTVARIGGDEFVLLLVGMATAREAHGPIQRIAEAVRAPLLFHESKLSLTASLGASVFPDNGDHPNILIRNADQAMLRAKRMGRDQFVFFSDEPD
jgi:diguanylate cyclase (GGDEF)-like protein/PAS domain S-box-containing protein